MPRKSSRLSVRKDRVWLTLKGESEDRLLGDNLALTFYRTRAQSTSATAVSPYNFLEQRLSLASGASVPTIRALRPFTLAAFHIVGQWATANYVGFIGLGIQGAMVNTSGQIQPPELGSVQAAKSFPLVAPVAPVGGGMDNLSGSVVNASSKGMRRVETGQFLYLSYVGFSADPTDITVRCLALL